MVIGKIIKGKHGKIDATFSMLDDDLVALSQGKISLQKALLKVRK